MNFRMSRTVVVFAAALMALSLAGCGEEGNDTPDAGSVKKDGGPPPSGKDGGPTGDLVETTIPAINNLDATDHPPSGSKVHLKGVVMSPMWRVDVRETNPDPAKWFCIYGVYLADPNATSAEHNGVLVVSNSTMIPDPAAPTDGKKAKCATDSPLQVLNTAKKLVIGEELEVTGFYHEECYPKSDACQDQFGGKGISLPQIRANRDGDLVRTGQNPGAPASLPAKGVKIEDIFSAGGSTGITGLGGKWWQYRTVLVQLSDVKVVDATSQPSNNWLVAPASAATPTLIVNDDVMFDGKKHSPNQDTVLTTLNGFVYWTYNSTQLSPRATSDSNPAMP